MHYDWMDNPAAIDPTFSLLPADEQQAILAIFRRVEKDVSTTTNPITAGSKKVAQVIDMTPFANVPRLPEMTLAEKVASELAECENCTGDCRKSHDRWRYPELEGETVWYYTCEFGKQRKIQRELDRMFRSSKIPPRYLNKTFDDYKTDNSNREAVTFAKQALNLKIGAYFYGECGTGKTFLASIIAQDFLKAGKSVVFIKVPSLLDDIKATFNGNGSELDLLDELQAAQLVVLDDFGMEKPTQWAGSTLCKVLDMRYDNPSGRTIVTSNLSINELERQLNNPEKEAANLNGSRIADRLREICKPVLLRGTTRRH